MLKQFINTIEVDNALLWVLINKFWSIAKGPISLIFIISCLTPEEQGLWYTFLSLGALTVFAEMGFTGIISQFVSHEYAHLKERNGFFSGNIEARDKLVSLIRYSLKFYLLIIPFAILILLFVGKYFLIDVNRNIFLLWMVFSITGGFQLLISLFQAIIQGFDKIALVQKNIFIGSLILPLVSWTLLYFGFGISTLVIANIVSIILMLSLLYLKTKKIFFQISKHKIKTHYTWFNEIVKLQWKYAVSWIAGYFIFQFMTPMIYRNEGVVLAGQFGMTLGLIKNISSISGSWLETKVPKLNMLVAHKDRIALDNMFGKNALIGFIIFFFISTLFLFIIYFVNLYQFHADRFLSLHLVSLLILLEVPNIITGYLAKYLRAHKAEPFYGISVLMGALFFFIISLLNNEHVGIAKVLVYLNIVNWFVILPLAIFIYKQFKISYYKEI